MSNWNFYCAKDYSLKQAGITLLLCFFSITLWGQPPTRVHLSQSITPEKLQYKKDSLQSFTRIAVSGIFREIDLDLRSAEQSSRNNSTIYRWYLSHTHVQSRVYANIESLGRRDTIYLRSTDGGVLEMVHHQNLQGPKHLFKPVSEGQVIQLVRATGSRCQVKLYGMSLETIPPQWNPPQWKTSDFGNSKFCQVNVNCNEGIPYSDIKNSVVRIFVRLGSALGFCTGSVISTSNYTYEPYLLTAEHCGLLSPGTLVSSEDLDDWVFFFNYQSPDCTNPPSEGTLDQQQVVGASLLANSDDNGGDRGSDFLLLRLNTSIPDSYNVYYAGWNRKGDSNPQMGATIHHPSGDIKKISTYFNPASSGSFTSQASNTHWVVNWNATTNGHGTTEAGSSGCPLYDENGLIRGVLTGGSASCNNLNGEDYFGKFSYSWSRNGNTPTRRLMDWLDPASNGFLAIGGSYRGDSIPAAGNEIIIVNNPVRDGVLAIKNLGTPTDDLRILIFDYSGKVVYDRKTVAIAGTDQEVNTYSWRNGLYILLVLRNEESISQKVLVLN